MKCVTYKDNHAFVSNSFLPLFNLVHEYVTCVSKGDLDIYRAQQNDIERLFKSSIVIHKRIGGDIEASTQNVVCYASRSAIFQEIKSDVVTKQLDRHWSPIVVQYEVLGTRTIEVGDRETCNLSSDVN